MQLAVEMWPCSMSATGLPREAMAARKSCMWRADGRGDVPLQVLLGLVLGVLLQLVGDVAVDRRSAAQRGEVVAVDAHLQRALVAVDGRAPGVLRDRASLPQVRCCQTTFRSPKSKVAVCVSVMFALLFLSTRMPPVEATRLRPAQVEHPADHVEHVDAHVADDAVAVLHERPPAARDGRCGL